MKLNKLADVPPWEWPAGTDQQLLEVLRDGRAPAEERLLAAELAGVSTGFDDDFAHALLAVVRNPREPDPLRSHAAISLGPALENAALYGFDEDDADLVPIEERTFVEIQTTLRTLYEDSSTAPSVQRGILEASVRAPQEWHGDAIRAAWASDDEQWKLTAAFGMRFVPGLEEAILEALASADPQIYLEALRAAGNWELQEAWEQARDLAMSDDTERGLRLAAIEAAVNIRPAEAADALAELLDSEDEELADAVHEALAVAGVSQGYDEGDDPSDDDFDGDDEEEDDDEDDDRG